MAPLSCSYCSYSFVSRVRICSFTGNVLSHEFFKTITDRPRRLSADQPQIYKFRPRHYARLPPHTNAMPPPPPYSIVPYPLRLQTVRVPSHLTPVSSTQVLLAIASLRSYVPNTPRPSPAPPEWCYPTGRCAYLPSVIRYGQPINPPPSPLNPFPLLSPNMPKRMHMRCATAHKKCCCEIFLLARAPHSCPTQPALA